MEFVDYYKILEINPDASTAEVKDRYRALALQWHPDRNPDVDTTVKMQLINEAYLILNDAEARYRYDIEYDLYCRYSDEELRKTFMNPSADQFIVTDEILAKWMSNARRQAIEIVKESLRDIKALSTTGIRAASKEILKQVIGYSILVLLFIALSLLLRKC